MKNKTNKKALPTARRIENSLTIAISRKSSSLIEENKKQISRYVKEEKKSELTYRVLIVDFKNEYKGTKITLDDLKTFKNKVAVIGNKGMSEKEKTRLIIDVVNNYSDGLLVVNELNTVVSKTKNKNLVLSITTNRHKKVDVIVGWGAGINNIPVTLIQNTDYLRLHDADDSIGCKNDNMCLIGGNILKRNKELKHIYVDRNKEKVFGCTWEQYTYGYRQANMFYVYGFKNIRHLESLCSKIKKLKTDIDEKPTVKQKELLARIFFKENNLSYKKMKIIAHKHEQFGKLEFNYSEVNHP